MRAGVRIRTLSDDRLALCEQIGVDNAGSTLDPLETAQVPQDADFSGVSLLDHISDIIDTTDWATVAARVVAYLKEVVHWPSS